MRFLTLCVVVLGTLVLAAPASAASTFYIRGGGDGHGIGLSQYGACGYALHGKDYRFILAHYYQGTSIGTADPTHTVRVLLSTGSAAFTGATQAEGKRLNPLLTYSVHALADGSLSLVTPSGKQVGRFPAPLVVTGPSPLRVGGLGLYRGALEFRPAAGAGVETVNALGLDDYVRGVISAEMPAGWAPEALNAQAVAARTYAITSDVGGSNFDLYSDTRSQMYRGVSAETPSTDAAAAATRGQVVTYKGVPVVTYFFDSSGGHTENVEDVWPGATPEPWLRGVPDPYDGAGGDPYHRWGYQMATTVAAAKLGGLVKGRLVGVNVLTHGSSPRILLAQVVGTRGRTTVTGIQLQQVFGLLTTYAAFTTISTLPSPLSPAPAGSERTAHTGADAILALVPLVRELVAGPARGIHGTVFPARRGEQVRVQREASGRWHTVATTRLAVGGVYGAALSASGTYRVLYNGLGGPAVSVT